MLLKKKESSCCSGAGCCGETATQATAPATSVSEGASASIRSLVIDFLYLDLEVCTRCQGTDDTLDQAVADVSSILQSAGIEVVINKVNVNTEELAILYQFASSPTIRIDGHDIAVDVKENQCDSCGDLCGDTVDCRIWTWHGVDYTEPPKAMIIDAILKTVYGGCASPSAEALKPYEVPENLHKFYDAMKQKNAPASTCCT
ncbi:MAG: DUF2703 domain-containing protein [Clostridia bacterium]|nr:DUF2703 domain-containing protein [Clostridia bacterium]